MGLGAAPGASVSDPGGWGFPYTVMPSLPRATDNTTMGVANDAMFYRVIGGGTISKVGLRVFTSSGNISVAAYRNSGVGRAGVPGTRLATSGAVACPATGYAEVSLGASIVLNSGDWLAISADNTTATFACFVSSMTTNDIAKAVALVQAAAHPAPSAPAGLVATGGRVIALVGVT